MYYFLCEGAKDKAEYTFVKSVINEFHTDDKYVLMSAGGNRNIFKCFLQLKSKFQANDVFILIFDHVETIQGELVYNLLLRLGKYCRDLGVVFRYTTYYCFEELFLSYPCILDIINVSLEVLHELKNVQSMLLSNHNYFKGDISFWKKYFSKEIGVLRTREHLSAGICSSVLKTAKGDFNLSKNVIGSCWISDCSMSSLHRNVCDLCKYRFKGCTFREKLNSIDSTSVSKFGLPFSTIFDSLSTM